MTETIQLKDISLKIGSGATPRGGKGAYKATGISLIRSMNVYDAAFEYKDLAFIDDAQAEKLSNVEVNENDILLNITGASVARCCMVPEKVLPARVNQHVAIIRIDQTIASPDYVFLCLVSPEYKNRLLALAQGGATREALTKTAIEEFEIWLPKLGRQIEIAEIITSYSKLIENNNRRIEILETIAQKLYQEWFVHYRFPNHQQAQWQDTDQGKIPAGWEVKYFTEIADVLGGGTPSTKNPEYWGGDIKFFAPKDAPDSFYVLDTDRKTTPKGIEKSSTKLYPKDTVFITARGTVGKVVLPAEDMAMNQSCYALRMKNGENQRFLFLLVKEQVAYLKKNTGGATFDTIVTDTFKSMSVTVPSIQLICHFEDLISPIFDEILCLLKKNKNLKRQRDLLLQKLIGC